MLFEQLRESGPRQVLVRTRQAAVAELLRAILREWHYLTAPAPTGRKVALVEYGLPVPDGVDHTLWMSPRPLATAAHLAVPLSLSALYRELHAGFFQPPRRYLRLAMDLPVQLERSGVSLEGQLLCLSVRGSRIACYASLPIGESWQLNATLGGYPLQIRAEIIYIIPPGDVPGKEQSQYGMQFKPFPPELCRAVCRYVEGILVERACEQTGIANDDPVLTWFDTSAKPWGDLSG